MWLYCEIHASLHNVLSILLQICPLVQVNTLPITFISVRIRVSITCWKSLLSLPFTGWSPFSNRELKLPHIHKGVVRLAANLIEEVSTYFFKISFEIICSVQPKKRKSNKVSMFDVKTQEYAHIILYYRCFDDLINTRTRSLAECSCPSSS